MWGGAEDGESGGFRFNFGGDADVAAAVDPAAGRKHENEEEEAAEGRIAGTEVLASEVPDPVPGWRPELVRLDDFVTLVKGAVTSTDAANALGSADGDIARRSDLVRGKYEGGFKLWECSLDLARHLLRTANAPDGPRLHGADVLELGCGHGVPGIVAALRGARRVTLCDYNPEVIRALAVPNVRANFITDEMRDRFAYVAGDWGDLDAFVSAQSADVVLAAETIYSTASYERHVRLLRRAMREPDGEALIAAKRYYFGVGGGTDAFRAAIERAHPDMTVETVESFSDGASNVREILRVRYRRRAIGARNLI